MSLVRRLVSKKAALMSILAPKSSSLQPWPTGGMRDVQELDRALIRAQEMRQVSEAQFVQALAGFWYEFSPPKVDPMSQEFTDYWHNMYVQLANRPYSVANEKWDFDLDHHVTNPYPFCTQDPQTVARQLQAYSSIISSMALPAGASIIELGAGWGNTSLLLAQMGYRVTVVDINDKYGTLIKRRAERLGVEIEYVCGDFFSVPEMASRFDGILFFESFHHCHDHVRLLRELPLVMKSDSVLLLAGEPIKNNLPYSWGINPTGEALWQIRTNGWMELVFRESYLLDVLAKTGYSVNKVDAQGNPAGVVYICRRS